jgi:cytochrome b involved in lipid metabolism
MVEQANIKEIVLSSSHVKLSQESREKGHWLVIRNHVVDISRFKDEHPGGSDILMEVCETDATEEFENIGHSESAIEEMLKHSVGTIQNESHQNKPSQPQVQSEKESSFWGILRKWF